jgi:hypothetical protein
MKKDVLSQQYSDKYLKEILAQSIDIIIYMRGFKIYEICEVVFSPENGINYRKLFGFYAHEVKDGEVTGEFINFDKPKGRALQKIKLTEINRKENKL